MIAQDLARFYDDPLGYVMWCFPWGKPGTVLEGQSGPRAWQRDLLLDIGAQVKERKFDGVNPVAPIQQAVASGHGIGKALRSDDSIITPLGLRRVNDIKVGDYLFGEDGRPVKVKAKATYKDIPFFNVLFSDRSSVDVSSGHLWKVKGRQERRKKTNKWRVLETKEILDLGVKRSNGDKRCLQWEIPSNGFVEFPKKRHNVDPYTYGVWLGDGGKRSAKITCADKEVWDGLAKAYSFKPINWNTISKTKDYERTLYGFLSDLKAYNLYGCTTYNAYVNREYIESSERLKVFQGLMDTDGWVESSCGSAAFASASKQLALDVTEIARSLGLKATSPRFKPNDKAGSWSTHITWDGKTQIFRVKRKQNRLKCPKQDRYFKRWIEGIKPVGTFDGVCFEVEGEMFLTKEYHVTHNSCITAWIIKWILDTRPYSKGVVTANTSDQLRTKTWAEVGKWHSLSLTKFLFDYHATKGNMNLVSTEAPEQWRCDAMTCREENSEAFAGLHAVSSTPFYIFDESSAVPEKIFEVAQGGLTDGEPMIFLFGNPTRNTGFFRQAFGRMSHRWKTKQIDSRSVEGTNKDIMAKWIEDYGEDSDFVRVRVRGVFPRASVKQLIPGDIVTFAQKNKLHPSKYNFAPIILGVDVAWYGDDRNCIFIRQGLASKILFVGREVDSIFLAGKIARYEDDFEVDATFIDAAMGNGVIDQLRALNRDPIPVYFNGKSLREDCKNKRAEMWVEMKEWLALSPVLPNNTELFDDLTGPEYFTTLDGKIQLERKEDMKKRGLNSPDMGDALALTFADPVYKKTKKQRLGIDDSDKVITEYNLFK